MSQEKIEIKYNGFTFVLNKDDKPLTEKEMQEITGLAAAMIEENKPLDISA